MMSRGVIKMRVVLVNSLKNNHFKRIFKDEVHIQYKNSNYNELTRFNYLFNSDNLYNTVKIN